MSILRLVLLLSLGFYLQLAVGKPYQLGQNSKSKRIIGQQTLYRVQESQSFHDIARLTDSGVLALIEANPGVDPLLPPKGSNIIIPEELILPKVYPLGIVINLAELRLYYFPKGEATVHVFPVGIGRHQLPTPNMSSYISEKRYQPSWHPPEVLRQRHYQNTGEQLPQVVPPGPNNPLGDYAMRLGNSEYLIHSTNTEQGVGMRVSSGCIRMRPKDIAWLFEQVTEGTKVKVVNQPIKMTYGAHYGEKYIQVHQPLKKDPQDTPSLYPLPDKVKAFLGPDTEHHSQDIFRQASGLVIKLNTASSK
jgi:lipoprotein-anchoring transpeptidase ErfK/SrfK